MSAKTAGLLLLIPLLLLAAGWTAEAPAGPHVVVLGTAQDGGMPQIGCDFLLESSQPLVF